MMEEEWNLDQETENRKVLVTNSICREKKELRVSNFIKSGKGSDHLCYTV